MSNHWYTTSGDPCHTVIGKNGKQRSTTLRDARKLNLFPSVTTILSVQDKPMLTRWLMNELLFATMLEPFNPYEWEEDNWKSHALFMMRAKGKKAAERGTEIHNKLEDYYKNNVLWEDDIDYIKPTIDLIKTTFPKYSNWIAEATFAKNGVGGCVDLHHISPNKNLPNIIIDFKTKDKDNIEDVQQYDHHKMQLAAYQLGLDLSEKTRRFNIFISTNKNNPGKCKLIECTDYNRYLNMFSCLHRFWSLKNDYYPISN